MDDIMKITRDNKIKLTGIPCLVNKKTYNLPYTILITTYTIFYRNIYHPDIDLQRILWSNTNSDSQKVIYGWFVQQLNHNHPYNHNIFQEKNNLWIPIKVLPSQKKELTQLFYSHTTPQTLENFQIIKLTRNIISIISKLSAASNHPQESPCLPI